MKSEARGGIWGEMREEHKGEITALHFSRVEYLVPREQLLPREECVRKKKFDKEQLTLLGPKDRIG